LHIARRQEYIKPGDFKDLYGELEVVGKMLSGLSKSLEDGQ